MAIEALTGASEDRDPYDLDQPSPLPEIGALQMGDADRVADAEHAVGRADVVEGSVEERVEARLQLGDAWLALGAIAPALEVARQAFVLAPSDKRVLMRLGSLLARSGAHHESAEALAALARASGEIGAWLAAGRAFARAEAYDELERLVDELLVHAPHEPVAVRFAVDAARARPDGPSLPRRLLAAAKFFRERGESAEATRHAVDAWIESRGTLAGSMVAESVLARGNADAAFALAIDAAARALSAGDDAGALPALELAARAARGASAHDAEGAALLAAGLFTRDSALHEALRDWLAESGRTMDLAARLRADARRVIDPVQAAAAWKGVALVERAAWPARAAAALGEALSREPGDDEALAMLREIASEPETAAAARDALWWATRDELPQDLARRRLLLALGDLERDAGDPAAALAAYGKAWKAGERDAIARVEAVTPAAERLFVAADAALYALERAPREERGRALETLLEAVGTTPGAVRDLGQAARTLGLVVGADVRATDLLLTLQRRLGDRTALVGALRRVATRATSRQARARAAVELAERLDAGGATLEALEILEQLQDEQPECTEAIATQAALAEHMQDGRVARAALMAMARVERAPLARAALLRLGGAPAQDDPILVLVSRVLDEAPAPRERADTLAALAAVVGDSPALLARRTRALLAQPSEVAEAAEVARAFAASAPLSPEATIAWFGAAGIAGSAEQVADAAVAVVHSLATCRDAASVARAAVARLFALGEPVLGTRVLREASEALGLADRGLRASAVEYAQRQPDAAVAAELLEAALAGAAGAPNEEVTLLRELARRHHERGDRAGEAHALRRLMVFAPGDAETLERLGELLPAMGDRVTLARVLSLRLTAQVDPAARREAMLMLAALRFAGAEREAAVATLDRYAEEFSTADARGEVVRALVAAGEYEAALVRLLRWAERASEPREAARIYLSAARVARGRLGDATQALSLLRRGLAREPESPELLLYAEEVATAARAVEPMLDIYADLDATAAGEHGRCALAYRRAAFLEAVGERERALDAFLGVFDKKPVAGVVLSAIERLASAIERPAALLAVYRKLAEGAHTPDGRVRHYLDAAAVAREKMHDRRAALELGLLAHDVRRDEGTAHKVLEIARSLRSLDPQAFRSAVETLVDRTLEVADEIWDDQRKRELALQAAEMAAAEIADGARVATAVRIYLKGVEDKAQGQHEVAALLERVGASPALREAALGAMGSSERLRTPEAVTRPFAAIPKRSSAPEEGAEALREQVMAMASAGDVRGALASARAALQRVDDEALRAAAESIALEAGEGAAALELIDYRLDRTFDDAQRRALTLRAAEVLRVHLGRPAEARARLEAALARAPSDTELMRALHDVTEQLGAWDAVADLLARRIEHASDRAEVRALRLHRAAVLEQRFDDVAGAREELEAILEDEPAHRAALRYLADLHLREHRFRDAGECFARAAATTPVRSESAELLAMAGEAFTQGDDEVAADAQFRRALDLDPQCARALRGLHDLARRRGNLAEIERTLVLLSDAAESERDRAALRLAAARVALDAGAIYRAKGHLDAVRRIALPDEVAQLDAVLQAARDADRPISGHRIPAVRPGEGSARPSPPPLDGSHTASSGAVVAEPAMVPQPIEPAASAPSEPAVSMQPAPVEFVPSVTPLTSAESTDSTSPGAPTSRAESEEVEAIPLVRRSSSPAMSAVHVSSSPPAMRRASPISSAALSPSSSLPLPAEAPAPETQPEAPSSPSLADASDESLRDALARGDALAHRVLVERLARTDEGRLEALRLERQHFMEEPTRLDALESLARLYDLMARHDEARALRSVYDVLSGREASAAPLPLHLVPELPAEGAARMTLPGEHALVGEVGAILWESLGNAYRRDLSSYGVTGVDRISPTAPTDIARVYANVARVLQLPRTGLFVRGEVIGGAIAARTQPPAVILAAPLANDTAVSRHMLGQALEATRPANILASTLDPEECATLVRATVVAFGASGVMAGAPPAVARIARELFAALAPRTQRRLQEVLAELDALGFPLTRESWVRASETARARAGLLASGDFGISARIIVARHVGGGGEPDLRGALASLEPLRDLVRFAVSEQYLLLRWHESTASRVRRSGFSA